MSYNTCLIFPEKKNHRAKRIKAGVDTSKFVVRSHKGAIMRFFDRAEDMYRIWISKGHCYAVQNHINIESYNECR